MRGRGISYREALRAAAEYARQYEDLASGDRRQAFATIADELLDLALKTPSYRALDNLRKLLDDANRRVLKRVLKNNP